ncbi:MAG: 2-amino-4-hydroxy-6-hydroxymethyldihydropteridine diphosphokinase [Flavobacteriales bacterium]|nr:MAG: 2-amino-4-hydroxy-6-hydroxymethyldihydropteridine diphosphokinase [Flavobacteriales bacterium]
MNTAYLLLGGNLGVRVETLAMTVELIEKRIGQAAKKSSIYETEPWGFQHENKFLNQVIKVKTALLPIELLTKILKIEKQLGRTRNKSQYSARTIDIDILFYNNIIISEKNLQIPHPRLHERKFALVPLCEIASDLFHPILKKSIKKLLENCGDNSQVEVLN